MSIFCTKCGKQLEESQAFCPECGTKAVGLERPQQETASEQPQQEAVVTQQEVVQTPVVPAAPSAFSVALNQIPELLKTLFTKNAFENLAKFKGEKLLWIILLAVPAIFSAISAVCNFTSPAVAWLNGLGVWSSVSSTNRVASLLIALFASLALAFLFVVGIFLMGKIYSKKVSFFDAANAVGIAYIPVTIVATADIIFGFVPYASNLLHFIALAMFFILLYKAINEAFGETVCTWSYILLVIVVAVVFALFMGVLNLIMEPIFAPSLSGLFSTPSYGSLLDSLYDSLY